MEESRSRPRINARSYHSARCSGTSLADWLSDKLGVNNGEQKVQRSKKQYETGRPPPLVRKAAIRSPHITPSITTFKAVWERRNSLCTQGCRYGRTSDDSSLVATSYQPPNAGTVTSCITLGIKDPSRATSYPPACFLVLLYVLSCRLEQRTQRYGTS